MAGSWNRPPAGPRRAPLARRRRGRGHQLAAAALLASLLVPGAAAADLIQDLGATYEQVAHELAAAFPRVDTRVTAVEGETVRLGGPAVGRLRPGLELTVYRKGDLFRHPLTNQPLGHAEDEVATVTVTAVGADHALARVAVREADRTPTAGDGARITAGRIRVAVLPTAGVAVSTEAADQTALLLVSRLSALLDKTGRFLAVEPERVLEAVGPTAAGALPDPAELARRLGAAGALASRVVQEGRARVLETAWVSARTGATLWSGRTPVVRAVFPPRFAWEETPELQRRVTVPGPIRGLAVADLDGDGRAELLVADERAVALYRWQEGVGLVAAPAGEFRPGGLVLSLDAADVNGGGRAQVVVVDYRGGGEVVRSTVLEWAGERWRVLHEAGGRYLRVVPVRGEPWLLAQPVGETEPFGGGVRRLLWAEGRYREGPALRLPAGTTVYGLAFLQLASGPEPEAVALTPEDRLGVWTAGGRALWVSGDPYGGAAVTFPYTPAREQKDQDAIVGRVSGRIVALPSGGEGPEVLVFENLVPVGGQFRTFLPRLAPLAFTQGRIHRLRWQDGGFRRVWASRPTEGYIADFAYGDLDGDGVPEVVVGVVARGLEALNPLGRPKAQLVFFELP